MARIEVNTNDLEMVRSELDDVNAKIEQLLEVLRTGFGEEKDLQLYLNGYSKVEDLLNNTYDSVMSSANNVIMYNDELRNIEDAFVSRFEDIYVPKIDVENSVIFNPGNQTIEYKPEPEQIVVPSSGSEPTSLEEEPVYVDSTEVPLHDITQGGGWTADADTEVQEEPSEEEIPEEVGVEPPAPEAEANTDIGVLDSIISETRADEGSVPMSSDSLVSQLNSEITNTIGEVESGS